MKSYMQFLKNTEKMVVADVIEVMASHMSYRPAKGIKVALEEISQNSIYDADAANAYLKIFKTNNFTFSSKR